MEISNILRIIEGVQQGNVDKVICYAYKLIPTENHKNAEKLIRERFEENPISTVMESDTVMKAEKIKALQDELDVLKMRYLSQVSLYEELKKKVEKGECEEDCLDKFTY